MSGDDDEPVETQRAASPEQTQHAASLPNLQMNFDLQPRLTGKLLELRPIAPADSDALFAAASDPLIWELHPDRTRHTREGFQLYFDGALASGGALVAIERATGRIIGSSRYH